MGTDLSFWVITLEIKKKRLWELASVIEIYD